MTWWIPSGPALGAQTLAWRMDGSRMPFRDRILRFASRRRKESLNYVFLAGTGVATAFEAGGAKLALQTSGAIPSRLVEGRAFGQRQHYALP